MPELPDSPGRIDYMMAASERADVNGTSGQ